MTLSQRPTVFMYTQLPCINNFKLKNPVLRNDSNIHGLNHARILVYYVKRI